MARTPEIIPQTAHKPMVQMLERAEARGQRGVFQDWVSLMLCALNTPAREEEYMKRIQPYLKPDYSGERTIDGFAQGLSWLMIATAHTHHDVIGTVYEEFAATSKSRQQTLGQFFTPINVTEMMAEMICEPSNQPKTVCDPACGSGRTLLSAAKRLHADSLFVGVDIDPVCADMTALNLLLFNMNGLCLWGDSLGNEYWGGYRTYRSVLGGELHWLNDEEVKRVSERMIPYLETMNQDNPTKLVQFSMFE